MGFPVLPLLLGGGLLAAFMGGAKSASAADADETPEEKAEREKASKEAKQAAKSRNWQKAVADAIASKSPKIIKEVAAELRKAGKSSEAKALMAALTDLLADKQSRDDEKKEQARKKKRKQKEDRERRANRKKEAPEQKETDTPKIPAKKKQKQSEAKKRRRRRKRLERMRAEKQQQKEQEQKEEQAIEKNEPPPPPPPPSPERIHALQTMKALWEEGVESRWTSREPRGLVQTYQQQNGLDDDGLYGMGTARSFWEHYQLVPQNPFYYPRENTDQKIYEYRTWLESLAAAHPEHAELINVSLIPNLGK